MKQVLVFYTKNLQVYIYFYILAYATKIPYFRLRVEQDKNKFFSFRALEEQLSRSLAFPKPQNDFLLHVNQILFSL